MYPCVLIVNASGNLFERLSAFYYSCYYEVSKIIYKQADKIVCIYHVQRDIL